MNLKVIPGYEKYSITEDGQVYNNERYCWLKPYKCSSGYYTYHIYNRQMYVHRLVALTYIDYPDDCKYYEVDHKDENKGNNHYSNLQWISHSKNVKLSFERGNRGSWWKGKTRPSPSLETRRRMSNAKLKPVKVYKDDKFYMQFNSVQETADYYNVTRVTIFMAFKNEGKFRNLILKPAY